jgi:hypothetical protein
MTEQSVARGARRTPVEIEQIVREFGGSGVNRSQFCRRHGLALGTLNSYLKRVRGEAASGATPGGLVAVELAAVKPGADHEARCALAVVVSSGRRIEVSAAFDARTLQRLVQVLETM